MYGGPFGPFQLYTADFEFLNFSLRNLTFLPSNFLPSYFSLRNLTFLPSNFPLRNFTFLPSKCTTLTYLIRMRTGVLVHVAVLFQGFAVIPATAVARQSAFASHVKLRR